MDQKEMTERQREIVTASITQMVVDAAMPDRDGKRMPGEDLKKLAEDAADAISAGIKKISVGD